MSHPGRPDRMIAEDQNAVVPPAVAPPAPPPSIQQRRDFVAEQAKEMAADIQFAESKQPYKSRPRPPTTGPNTKDFEESLTLSLYESSSNNPYEPVNFEKESIYAANTLVMFSFIHEMNTCMMKTKQWTDNCGNWNPFVSFLYFSILVYIKLLEARRAAGFTNPAIEIFLNTFYTLFPTTLLTIPGPLIPAFQALSSFAPGKPTPDTGSVVPAFPDNPGWNRANLYSLTAGYGVCLPNPAHIISRMKTLTRLAADPNLTDEEWTHHVNGPLHISTIVGHTIPNTYQGSNVLIASGLMYAQPTTRSFWKTAASKLTELSLPADPTPAIEDDWIDFLRLRPNSGWFSAITTTMNRFSRYWKCSVTLSQIPAASIASPAFIFTPSATSTLVRRPTFHRSQGASNTTNVKAANTNDLQSHFDLITAPTLEVSGTCTIREIPEGHYFSAVSFVPNLAIPDGPVNPMIGPFWDVAPHVLEVVSADTLHGMRTIVTQRLYSPVALSG